MMKIPAICVDNKLLHSKELLNNAKINEEPFVCKALEDLGWIVVPGTYNEDLKGIDLKVEKNDTYKNLPNNFNIDVKGSSSNNRNSFNFLFTSKSYSGKEYHYNDNDYLAFIDYRDKTITIISQKIFKDFIKKFKEYNSKYNDSSKYILIPKNELKNIGIVINPSDEIKNILK